jgi:hypothetical protein
MLQRAGRSAEVARQLADDCRTAVLRSAQFDRLVHNLAKKPETKHRCCGLPGSKKTTAQILGQSLSSLFSTAGSIQQ